MTLSKRAARAVLGLLSAAGLALAFVLASQAAIHDKLVSRNSQGRAANGDSNSTRDRAISRNGRFVAFGSNAPNLPGGDGATTESYVRDVTNGKTHLISTKPNGDPADGDVFDPAISSNGRLVAFDGPGDGLPGANGLSQVWVHDRKSGKTRLVSKAKSGDPGDGASYGPSISASGRFVVFGSDSSNLPGGDGVHSFVYVRDRKKGTTTLASRTNGGAPAPGGLDGQSISSDGRRVVFESSDADLPGGDGSTGHVYLRDLPRHRTQLIDRTSGGEVASGGSEDPSISGPGGFVAFESTAANLPGGDGSTNQVYLRDLGHEETKLVSRNGSGRRQNGLAHEAQPSGNGRFVVFGATAANLPGGNGSTQQIYARDMRRGTTLLISKANNGDPGDDFSSEPSISLDGRFAAFSSAADNLGGNAAYSNVFRAGPIG